MVHWAAKPWHHHACKVSKKCRVAWLYEFGRNNVNSGIRAKVCKLDPQNCLVLTDLGFLDLNNLLGLYDLTNTISLKNKVGQVVPQGPFVNDYLDWSVDIPSDVPSVSTVLEVGHSHEMVVANVCMYFWHYLDLIKTVFDNFTFKCAE